MQPERGQLFSQGVREAEWQDEVGPSENIAGAELFRFAWVWFVRVFRLVLRHF